MAKRPSSSLFFSPLSLFLPRGDTLFYLIALLSICSLILHHLSLSSATPDSHFEGFDADDDEFLENDVVDLPLRSSPPPVTLSHSDPTESHHGPPDPNPASPKSDSSQPSDLKPSSTSFDHWDEDEFEGFPEQFPPEPSKFTESATPSEVSDPDAKPNPKPDVVKVSRSYTIEIVCVSFLIVFIINYFTGKKENENIALAWATKFATKDSIFEKNFSLLGIGEAEDSPLLLKEGQTVFKFYASGRRFCTGLLATMELQSRHDLISRLYNMVVPCRDEITFEVYMNDDAMDQVVFALAKKKVAKTMQKEVSDLQRFAGLVNPPSGKKWVVDELSVISESKEVAGDLITEAVLDQSDFYKIMELDLPLHSGASVSGNVQAFHLYFLDAIDFFFGLDI
ncbi:unnamed protein product [Ilex paraguariensis]|uniref:Uncharacterized protein n=1 Tax=Ilex paraguariensis TaxID=185542 RepID=A0ABC8TBC9_9AQUA